MPKPAKYNDDTPFSVLVNAYSSKQPTAVCHSAQTWNSRYLEKTLGETSSDLMDKDYEPGWGIWLLANFGTELDITVRKRLIAAIKDSMQAFSVYLTFAWLTDEEDKILEEKFKGKLPTAENELKQGIVTRAKWQ